MFGLLNLLSFILLSTFVTSIIILSTVSAVEKCIVNICGIWFALLIFKCTVIEKQKLAQHIQSVNLYGLHTCECRHGDGRAVVEISL